MSITYFRLQQDYDVTIYEKTTSVLGKGTIFHIQTRYVSPLTGEEMVVVAIDKNTPVALPSRVGEICG